MEIRQLEYFVTSVEEKSFYKAGAKLYTSQPAISKAIALLEKDVNTKLLERSSKGLKLTPKGEQFYHYAKNVLRQIEIMRNSALEGDEEYLRIASYPSRAIAKFLTSYYYQTKDNIYLEYQEGSVQDIIDLVYKGICEFGILYISPKQEQAFAHILGHNQLEFIPLKKGELCIYVGKKHALYGTQKVITTEELTQLKYIRGVRDFFSVEHHFDSVSLNAIDTAQFNDHIMTNSDHLVNEMLEQTDLCYLGIDTPVEDVKCRLGIDSEEKYLTLGYIKNKGGILTKTAEDFMLEVINSI